MTQLDFFRAAPIVQPPVIQDPWRGARYYQRECCEAILAGFKEYRSQLAVLATGLGKTWIFSAIARQWQGNVLVLAHREELLEQARERLEYMTGETVEIEQAERRAKKTTRIVVASLDTMRSRFRKDRFGKDHFSLVIHDECHRALAPTYRATLEWFNAKLLGVTATPDRGDEQALGKVFENVAYCFDIGRGIDAGYLVPLAGYQVVVDEIQLDGLTKVAGDLAKGQLDEVMVRAVEGIVSKTLELEPNRQGIAFFPGVKSASYAAERFNALRPDSAIFLSGETPSDQRKAMIRAFKDGRFQYLCNCMIATEGFDAPGVSLIIQGRPTLSRALSCQMVGRGTRVVPGLVEPLDGHERAAERRALIAASSKPNLVVLDFVGNGTKHALMTPVDILGADYSDEEVDLAKKKAKVAPGADAKKLLEDSRRELAAVAAAIRSKVQARVSVFNPFEILHVDHESATRSDLRWGRVAPTEKQLEALKRMGVPPVHLKALSKREASNLLAERSRRHDAGLATYSQLARIKEHVGLDDQNISFEAAGRVLTYVAKECDWGRRKKPDLHHALDLVCGRNPNV